jgi:hypothetical protein
MNLILLFIAQYVLRQGVVTLKGFNALNAHGLSAWGVMKV